MWQPALVKVSYAAVAIEVNGEEQTSETIANDAAVSILTTRTPAGFDIMRHTITAQVLARVAENV